MDTNSKQALYQANSFSKGIDADTSDMLISEESYRLAKNLRYVTDIDETSGELRLIEGVTSIPYSEPVGWDYLEEAASSTDSSSDSGSSDKGLIIRAFCSTRNVGALVCQKEDKSWAVFRIDVNDDNWSAHRIFGWCTDELNLDVKLSVVLKYEDTDLLLLYIADGKHQVMKINLYDQKGSSDIRYISSGWSFDKLNRVLFKTILAGGSLLSGIVQYSYRLYNDNNISTNFAPLSGMRAIINSQSKNPQLLQKIGPLGLAELTKSSMGLLISIDIDSDVSEVYNNILLYRIHYLVNGQPPKIELIYDDVLFTTNNTFVYDDTGSTSLLEITAEEFSAITGMFVSPKLIESKNNLLFAGNVNYDFDVLDSAILELDFRAFSSGDYLDVDAGIHVTRDNLPALNQNIVNRNLNFTLEYNPADWYTIQDELTTAIGGWGPNIEWAFDVDDSRTINKFPTQRRGDVNNYKIENSDVVNWGERGDGQNGECIKGLMHDEIYRYGIILYSKTGIKYPVKWIADIRTPKLNSEIGEADERNYLSTTLSHIYPNIEWENAHTLYVKFKVHKEALDDTKLSGYEIVRVHRTANDRATISLGIIAATVSFVGENDTKEVSCTGTPFLDHVRYVEAKKVVSSVTEYQNIFGIGTDKDIEYKYDVDLDNYFTETKVDVLLFFSPEISYLQDDVIDLLKTDTNYYLLCLYPLTTRIHYPDDSDSEHPWIVDLDVSIPYVPTYKGENITTIHIAHNMYSSDDMLYKFYYAKAAHNPERLKWYDSAKVKSHFLKPDSLIDDNVFTNLNGASIYKLHRKTGEGIPTDVLIGQQLRNPQFNYDIDGYSAINAISYDKLVDSDGFHGKDYLSYVGDHTIFHCVAPYILGQDKVSFLIEHLKQSADRNIFRDELIATCDPSLAVLPSTLLDDLKYNVINFFYTDYLYENRRGDNENGFEYTLLCNLRRNIIPYGGFDKYSRDNSTYILHGYYRDISFVDQYVKMYDGDTVVSTFEFVPAHKWYSPLYVSPRSTVVCLVAVESSIDMDLDHGEKFSNNTQNNSTLVLVQSCNFNDLYIQKRPAYLYNTAYSTDPQLLQVNYSSRQIKNSLDEFDYRVHYSNPASNNLALDPWLVFLPLNYLDVDPKHGPITELRTFKNQLLFWQEKAMGVLSVNERVQIATDSNLPLILGTGGVLERYDYLTTINGMNENLHADAQSDHTLYWWDYDNNTICAYSSGSIPVLLSKIKSVQNILNRAAKTGNLTTSNIQNSTYPILLYDKKYNEILFKVGKLEKLNKLGLGKADPGLKEHDEDNVLVYSELQQRFSSIYEIDPKCYFNIEQKLMFLNLDTNGKYNMYRWNYSNNSMSNGLNNHPLFPYLKYVINNLKGAVKVYDNVEFAGKMPNNNNWDNTDSWKYEEKASTLDKHVIFEFNTPLKQVGKINGTKMTNRQLDFKFAIPRNGYQDKVTQSWVTKEYGDRMRGKTMQCEIYSDINSLDFSLQYIITKYRMSWS